MRCAKCHRQLFAKPRFISGQGYGPVCAAKIQPEAPRGLFEKKPKRVSIITKTRKAKPDDTQLDLLQQLEAQGA